MLIYIYIYIDFPLEIEVDNAINVLEKGFKVSAMLGMSYTILKMFCNYTLSLMDIIVLILVLPQCTTTNISQYPYVTPNSLFPLLACYTFFIKIIYLNWEIKVWSHIFKFL